MDETKRSGIVRSFPAFLLMAAALAAAPAASAQVPGVTDGEIVFGMTGPLTGPSKLLGRQMRTGIEAAFAAQNRAGGVHGRKLTLAVADDGYEPERTKAAARDLVEKRRVFGFIGNVGTSTAAVSLPYALEKGLLYFGALSGSDILRNEPPDRLVFNYRASYWEETAAIVRYLVEVRRVKPSQIAVFAEEGADGDAGFEGVAYMMRKYKRDPAQVIRVGYKRNTTDVVEAVKTIKKAASKVEAVVMVPTYSAAARFIQKAKDENIDLIFAAVSFVGPSELAEQLVQLGPGYADGVVVTQVVPLPDSKSSAVLKYQQDLAQYSSADKPDFLSLEGWLSATLLIKGLENAGRNLTTDGLVAGLEQVRGLDLGAGTPFTFGPSEHQASHKVWLTALDAKGVYKPIHFP
jgi:ABC-type branched-subunit amino acid transport system substrate-binding protein